ncbi:MAG: septum formation initiator family protein [Thermoanaerobacterales bacterium]|nr:septum formation initiator family protein [Bacillota bacterium]MDI6907272.1 septum formation initiator family protein [Thermoanaerobacterales bacterium]
MEKMQTAGTARPRKRFNPTRSRLPLLFLAILLFYLGFSLVFQMNRLWAMQESVAEMQARVEELQTKNQGLWERLHVLQSDGYIEQVARERLGLVKPGETRVVPLPQGQASPDASHPAPASPQERPLDTSIRD